MNTMQAYPQNSVLSQPKTVCHWPNLMWWVVLICAVMAIQELPRFLGRAPTPLLSIGNGTEKEAFIALVFGRVSATRELAIPATSFKAQLAALKQAGYSSTRLEHINQWWQTDKAPLQDKPMLLTFEEPNRETMAIADEMLTTLGMTALVFVDVNQLDQGNTQLVSWHQLEQMVKTGRWEVGISGCPNGDEQAFTSPTLLAQRFAQQRELLERRLRIPVIVANCSRAWYSNSEDGAKVWTQALNTASMPVGFVPAAIGANYRNDPEHSFKSIRVSKVWDQADLLAQINSHAPRRMTFIDKFQSDRPASEWVVESGEIAIENGTLRMSNKSGEQGALMPLGGTEKWQDADVEVQLKGQPEGQFWVSLRQRRGQPLVRLGISEGQVMLQSSDGIGMTKQLASRDAPSGNIALRLRVVGSRAVAYLNGQPLLARPIEVLPGADHGAFALAVWNEKGNTVGVGSEKALVTMTQVTATPLFPKCGIIAATAGPVAWTQLRKQSEELSIISPLYFNWIGGKPQTSQVRDIGMEIFAQYHRLNLQPALFIDGDTPLSDIAALSEQALVWASNPAYQGLNVILHSAMVGDEWRSFLSDLNQRMGKVGKTLTVTLLDGKEQGMPIVKNDELLLVASHNDLLSASPRVLYPSPLTTASAQ